MEELIYGFLGIFQRELQIADSNSNTIGILIPTIIIMMIIIFIVDECFMLWKLLLIQIIDVGGLTKNDAGPSECLNRSISSRASKVSVQSTLALVLRGKTVMGERKEEWEKFLTSITKKAAL